MVIHPLWDRSRTMKMNNPPSSSFIKGGMTPPFFKGRLGGILCNSKGISVLFLVIAMMLMVTIGYVFSYLIPTKQKSVRFPIYSTQAFFIAQSGVEYAIRYASDRGWRGTTDGVYDLTLLNGSYPMGNGTFTLSYSPPPTNTLTSTGQITGSSENRVVQVTNFTPFLRLIFNPGSAAPRWTQGTRRARFFFRNVRGTNITLTGFAASWNSGVTRTITDITLDGNWRWNNGNYSSDPDLSPTQPFNGGSETVVPNEVITVVVYWSGNTNAQDIIIKFFTAAGEGYTFNLDPASDGLP